jgi:hypothetical protein
MAPRREQFLHLVFDGGGGKGEKESTMKLKDAFLCLCIVALLVSEISLFRANEQKRDALVKSTESQHDAQQARAALEQLKADTDAQSTEDARLRSANQSLAQKISQLQTETNKLGSVNLLIARQLAALQDATQQQEEQLLQIQAENQVAAERNVCIANLREINAAKAAWALDNNKSADSVPTAQDLLSYFPDGVFPVCPSGGIYTINSMSAPPTCSIPGHVLPPQ